MIGINQDNRVDGNGKAGLTFQTMGNFIKSPMNTAYSNAGGWRDTLLRKNLNDESTGTIWNAIQSTDFKNNITPVLKMTNNNASVKNNSYSGSNSYKTSNASSITSDKLWILSPSEMGMPIIKKYAEIVGWYGYLNGNLLLNGRLNDNANVHYFDMNSYSNTIKSSDDGNYGYGWFSQYHYIYAGNTYQWWMLPAGSRKMSNGNQAYHNTDSYSYCAISLKNSYTPSSNKTCSAINVSWLRSNYYYNYYNNNYRYALGNDSFSSLYEGSLSATYSTKSNASSIISFSF